jgi:hypothetical protein
MAGATMDTTVLAVNLLLVTQATDPSIILHVVRQTVKKVIVWTGCREILPGPWVHALIQFLKMEED